MHQFFGGTSSVTEVGRWPQERASALDSDRGSFVATAKLVLDPDQILGWLGSGCEFNEHPAPSVSVHTLWTKLGAH